LTKPKAGKVRNYNYQRRQKPNAPRDSKQVCMCALPVIGAVKNIANQRLIFVHTHKPRNAKDASDKSRGIKRETPPKVKGAYRLMYQSAAIKINIKTPKRQSSKNSRSFTMGDA